LTLTPVSSATISSSTSAGPRRRQTRFGVWSAGCNSGEVHTKEVIETLSLVRAQKALILPLIDWFESCPLTSTGFE
jgi:hypothetical protein